MDNVVVERAARNQRCLVEVRSAIGGREEQQDRAYAYMDAHVVLAVVCDGIGGMTGGETASEIAITAMRAAHLEYLREIQSDDSAFLYRAMQRANNAVCGRIGAGLGGTTMVAARICEDHLHWISVGDSRLYIYRSGELFQATRDHNYALRLTEMRDAGELSEASYAREKCRGEALISYIGMGEVTLFDLTRAKFALRPGDQLLLATDGLFKVLSPEDLREILGIGLETAVKADALLERVSLRADRDIQDNTTFILIDIL